MTTARKTIALATAASALGLVLFNAFWPVGHGTLEGIAAVGQLNGGPGAYIAARQAALGHTGQIVNWVGWLGVAAGLIMLSLPRPAGAGQGGRESGRGRLRGGRGGSMPSAALLPLMGLLVLTQGCGPYKKEKIEEVEPNETAFLVPLEGGTQQQEQFQSVDYLESRKVAVKRVTIPQRKLATGRMWNDYQWIPTARLIRVDRSPVTREWTHEAGTGTSKSNQAIYVESSDSIGFGIGVNITAAVEEPSTAKFLYHYAGKPLQEVIDTNVRGRVASFLSREFGRYPLEKCRSQKVEIFDACQKAITTEFAELGITIRNLDYAEGMVYDDPEIQRAINETFVVELRKQVAEEERQAQAVTNQKEIEMAIAKRQQAEEFAKAAEAQQALVDLEIRRTEAQALLTAAEKWNGVTPSFLLAPGGGGAAGGGSMPGLLMQMPAMSAQAR